MAALHCEMCGSTDIMKQDGVFVCQSCGMKYSVEDAKKMMIEGTVEVTGTVKVDESSKAENYLELAKNAVLSKNNENAENYCNKVLEIDSSNSTAWLIKGEAVGFQYSQDKNRYLEALECFGKSINCASKEALEKTKKTVSANILSLTDTVVDFYCEQFKQFPSKNENTVTQIINSINNTAFSILSKCNTAVDELAEKEEKRFFRLLLLCGVRLGKIKLRLRFNLKKSQVAI